MREGVNQNEYKKEFPLIAGFALLFLGLPFSSAPREVTGFALLAFSPYGAYSEIGTPKGQLRLFSGTDFLVPLCVPILLVWTYFIMALDGQRLTQKIFGIYACLVCIEMTWFYVKGNFNKALKMGIAVFMISCTLGVLVQRVMYIDFAYEQQKHFNQNDPS